MDAIQLIARGTLYEGKLEEFKALAAECIRKVREKEPGALQYDWFLNADQKECVVLESYKDSSAVLDHIANLGPTLEALFSLGDWTFELFGSPSPELLKATADLTLKVYSPLPSK